MKPPAPSAPAAARAMMALRDLEGEHPDKALAAKALAVAVAALDVLAPSPPPAPADADAVRLAADARRSTEKRSAAEAVERAYAAMRRESSAPEGAKIRDALHYVELVLHRMHDGGFDGPQAAGTLKGLLEGNVDPKFAKADFVGVQRLLEGFAPDKPARKGKLTIAGIVARLIQETGALGKGATLQKTLQRVDRASRMK